MNRSTGPAAVHRLTLLAALTWLALAVLELGLALGLPEGALRRMTLPWSGRLAIVGLDLLVLAGLIGAGVLVALPLLSLAAPFPRVARALGAIPSLVLGVALAGSWGTYHQTGAFPGQEALAFLRQSGLQVTQHVAQQSLLLLFLVPLGVLGIAIGVSFGLPAVADRLDPRSERAVTRGALAGVGASGLVALAGHLTLGQSTEEVHEPHTGAAVEVREAFAFERDYHGGALWAAAHELWRSIRSAPSRKLTVRPDIEVERRPILEMEAYERLASERGFRPWNVITVIIESLRRDQLTLLGSPRVVMPHLDELSRRGRVFSNVYTQASHSDFADPCVLSSQYPVRGLYGARTYSKDPSYPRVLIYDVLHALGHRTAIISSQNETWGGMIDFLDTGGLDLILHSETFEGPTYVPHKDPAFSGWLKGTKRAGKIDDRFTVGEALEWISEAPERPFFIYMNLQNSHIPYEIPADFPRRFAQEHDEFSFTMAKIEQDDIETAKNLYADSLAYVDAQLGRLFDHLSALSLWDRTVVVVTGDTGQAFMEHGFFTHARDLYNEVMRVPVVVAAPGLSHGVDDRLAQHIDIPPTVLELLGLPPHPSFQGRSLLEPEPDPDRSVYLTVRTPFAHQYAIVQGSMKLISDRRKDDALLYDLERDPGETQDISRLRPRVTRRLLGRLETWLHHQVSYYTSPERHDDEYPPVLRD